MSQATGIFAHFEHPRYQGLVAACRSAGVGAALPSAVIAELGYDMKPELTAPEWREVESLVREELKPRVVTAKREKQQQLDLLHENYPKSKRRR